MVGWDRRSSLLSRVRFPSGSPGGQLGFVAGQPRPVDQVVEESGQELLRIDGTVSRQLAGQRLNRVDTAEGPRLTIEVPEQHEQPEPEGCSRVRRPERRHRRRRRVSEASATIPGWASQRMSRCGCARAGRIVQAFRARAGAARGPLSCTSGAACARFRHAGEGRSFLTEGEFVRPHYFRATSLPAA